MGLVGGGGITNLALTPFAVFTSSKTLLGHSCLLTQQTRRILLMFLMWERHKQVRRVVAPRLELFSLTGEEPAVAGEGAGLLIPN